MWAARLRHDGGAAFAALPKRSVWACAAKSGSVQSGVRHAADGQCSDSKHVAANREGGSADDVREMLEFRLQFESWAIRAATGVVEVLPNNFCPARASEGRWDFPKRPRLQLKAQGISPEDSLDRSFLLGEYEADVFASTTSSSFVSRLRTWARLHVLWFGNDVWVLPLTPAKVKAVASLLKKGGCASGPNNKQARRVLGALRKKFT